MDKQKINNIVNFLFEAGMLAKTPRSGFFFLGSGEQSVAEHINRTAYIGFVLASMAENVDTSKVLKMCLFHDLAEARTSDLNYVHQKYAERQENKAVEDLAKTLPFGNEIRLIINEFEERKSREAKLAKDADQLEFLLSLKEQVDIGNSKAETWIPQSLKRLITDEAKELAETIIKTESDNWWYSEKEDGWWVHRNKKELS